MADANGVQTFRCNQLPNLCSALAIPETIELTTDDTIPETKEPKLQFPVKSVKFTGLLST